MNSTVIKELQAMQCLEGFDYHRSMVGMRLFFLIFLYFTASDHNKLYYTTFL